MKKSSSLGFRIKLRFSILIGLCISVPARAADADYVNPRNGLVVAPSPALSLVDNLSIIRERFWQSSDSSEKMIQSGRMDGAFSILETFNDRFIDTRIFAEILLTAFLARKHEDLIDDCKTWLERNPSAPAASKALVLEFQGTSFCRLKKFNEAIKCFEKGIEYEPTETSKAGLKYASQRKVKPVVFSNGTRADKLQTQFIRTTGVPVVEFESSYNGTSKPEQGPEQHAWQLADTAKKLEESGDFEKSAGLFAEAVRISELDSNLWGRYALCVLTKAVQTDGAYDNQDLQKAEALFKKGLSLNQKDWRLQNNLAAAKYACSIPDSEVALSDLLKYKNLPLWQRSAGEFAVKTCERMAESGQRKEQLRKQLLSR